MRRLLHGLIGLSLLLGACSDDDAGDDLAAVTSVPDETTTSTTTTTEARTVAPDVIPQDESQITEEYVEAVLNELYEVSFEAMLLTREAGVVDASVIELMEATSSTDVLPQRLNDLSGLATTDFEGIRSDPAPLSLTVIEVLEATSACAIAEVETDASGLLESPPEDPETARDFVRIIAAAHDQRASGLNPTAWVLDEFPVTMDGSVPDLRCDA